MTIDAAKLANDWIAFWHERQRTGRFPKLAGSGDLDRMVHDDPALAWDAIKTIMSQVDPQPSNPMFQVLAAGPVETLLNLHGLQFIDRVETEARRNPRFNLLLGGVWRSTIDPTVWARVERIRNNVW